MFSQRLKLAYLAGIIDGEGCISIRRWIDKKVYVGYSLMLDVGNAKPALAEWIKENFGGTVSHTAFKHPNHNDRYVWRISHGRAGEIIKSVQPFLLLKQEQAKLALEFRDTFHKDNTKGLPSDIHKHREQLIADLHILNKRGKF